MLTQQTVQISPVDAEKLVEKIDNILAEGFTQVLVTALDPGVYGLNASKATVEELANAGVRTKGK